MRAGARAIGGERRRGEREPYGPSGREEGTGGGRPAGERGRERGRACAPRLGRHRQAERARALRTPARRRAAQRGGEARRRRAAAGARRQRAVDELDELSRQVGAHRRERRRAGLDRPRGLEHRRLPERMPPCERLPQHHAHRPHVGCLGGVLACEPLGRDVRERARHVALRRERLRLRHSGEAEVEELRRHAIALREKDVRRLHVAMEDPRSVRVREPLRDLRARLDGAGVVERAGAQGLAEGAAGDELVRDVDMPAVARECIRAQAARVTQPGGGRRLALCARGRLALARDDLEGDVETRLLVSCQPDRSRPAAAERTQGPVATEDGLAVMQCER